MPLPDFWGGYRVVPDVVELWEHRENRLHDRVRYERDGDGWQGTRIDAVGGAVETRPYAGARALTV